ncbi:protein-export chaperone SecB [Cellvibrio sp. KY-GH-1]|uniref:protein-export chaperone SecB n=1 Tax=Cellvibrio sp. KY-GH-1 TaxID=2303332 RepID=UPI001246E6C7|nr:protein-export chaperone SecB [Cellvibrio sp. KY-GH-1]QEY17715.1 protein-export chaperone SecB [Cellvibrio sp. KY-GH-1]
MSEENNQQAAEGAQGPIFAIQRIYLKDISFETPMGPEAFTKAYKPNIQQDLNIQANQIEEGLFEVVLLLTITARIEDRAVFLVEVKQAGLFAIANIEGAAVTQLINTACPQILFPYAREAIDSILGRGSFPPLMLAPINFDAVFVQAIAAAQQQVEQAQAEKPEVVN